MASQASAAELLERKRLLTFEKDNLAYDMSFKKAKLLLSTAGICLDNEEGINAASDALLMRTKNLDRKQVEEDQRVESSKVDIRRPFRKINRARQMLLERLTRKESFKGSEDDIRICEKAQAEKERIADEAAEEKEKAEKQIAARLKQEHDQPLEDQWIQEDTRRKNLVTSAGFESMDIKIAKDALAWGSKPNPEKIQDIFSAWDRVIKTTNINISEKDPEAAIKTVNKGREKMFSRLPPSEQASVDEWRDNWNKLVEDEHQRFRRYYKIGTGKLAVMEHEKALGVLNLVNPPLTDMKIIRYAWETAVLPTHPGGADHAVDVIQKINMARDSVFLKVIDKKEILLWQNDMNGQDELDDHQEVLLMPLEGLPEPLTEQSSNDGRIALEERVVAQQIEIEMLKSELLGVKQVVGDLVELKQVVGDLVETVRSLKRVSRSSDNSGNEMSDNNKEDSGEETKGQCEIKHRRIEDVEVLKKLLADIKLFVATEFVEKPGAHVLCSELCAIFQRSRGEVSEFEKNVFKKYAKRHFEAQWPKVRYGRIQNKRCYQHIAVKSQ